MRKLTLSFAIALTVLICSDSFATHYWTGSVNHLWSNPGNWDEGTVPGSGDDVIIVSGTPNTCWISVTDQSCNNLFIMGNASLRVYDETLFVYGNIYVYGTLVMDNSSGNIFAYNDVIWYSGSQASITAWAPIKVYGNWEFRSGANVHLDNGFVEFMGTNPCNIICKSSNSYFNWLDITYSHTVTFSSLSTQDLVLNGKLSIGSGATFSSSSSHNIVLNGQLSVSGELNLSNGTLIYNGPYSTNDFGTDYVNNLTINSGIFNFTGLLRIYGNLTLNGGVFQPDHVYLYGNWLNYAGTNAFDEGTSMIIFRGSGYQMCMSETFYDLQVYKTGGYMYPQAGATILVTYSMTIYQGTLKMNTNSTLDLDGPVNLSEGGFLDGSTYSGAKILLYSYFYDYNTTSSGFIPGTSTFIIDNTNYYCLLSTDAPSISFYDLKIVGGGSFRTFDNINVLHNLTITNGSLSIDSYQTCHHKFYGNITVEQNGHFFDKSNIDFEGSGQTFNIASGYAVMGDVTVTSSKNGKSGFVNFVSNDTSAVFSARDLTVNSGELNIGDNYLSLDGDIDINNGGELILSEGAGLKLSDGKQLNVNNGGYFKSYGTAQKKVTVSCSDGFYGFYINLNGNIAAKHTVFEYMNADGIRMKYGSQINSAYPFDYCVFRKGEANGTFLFINSAQDIAIANAVFEDNINGSTFNITRTLNIGSVTLKWAKGDFAGEAHEYDYYGNVYWDYTPLQVSAKVFLEGPYNGTSMNTNLNSQIPLTQPYAGSPWNYGGAESVPAITNPDIVDWVLLELRATNLWASTTTNESVIARRACFLLSDGTFMDTDNSTTIPFDAALGSNEVLYLVVKHRNHLGVLSAWALSESGGVYNYDFSTGPGQYVGSNEGCSYLGNSVWGMIAGDANADGTISYPDINSPWHSSAGESGYLQGDLNLDGQVDNSDKNDDLIPNLWKSSKIPE